MKSKAAAHESTPRVSLKIQTIEWANNLRLYLFEMASRLLKTTVKRRFEEIKAIRTKADVPA